MPCLFVYLFTYAYNASLIWGTFPFWGGLWGICVLLKASVLFIKLMPLQSSAYSLFILLLLLDTFSITCESTDNIWMDGITKINYFNGKDQLITFISCLTSSFKKYIILKINCTYLVCVCMCRSEDNLWEWFLSFNHVSPQDRTQVIRFGSKYPLPTKPSQWLIYLFVHITYSFQ